MKQVEGAGLGGTAPSAAVFLASFLLILPLLACRWRSVSQRLGDLAVTGVFSGGALGLFTVALAETEIVRAILLFYLSPVWSTALGMIFLGDRPNAARITTLALGLVGLVVVLGIDDGFPWPRNFGDTLALISGLCWSLASLKLYRMPKAPIPDLVVAFVTGCLVVTGALFLFSTDPMPQTAVIAVAPWIIFAGLYIIPTLAMTLWPATILLPAKAGLLLMTEVVVGTVSAAFLSGEAFGLREGLGCVLIGGALLAEILMPSNVVSQPSREAP